MIFSLHISIEGGIKKVVVIYRRPMFVNNADFYDRVSKSVKEANAIIGWHSADCRFIKVEIPIEVMS